MTNEVVLNIVLPKITISV